MERGVIVMPHPDDKFPDVAIDPALRALYERALELAESDVREGLDPRVLDGDLADFQIEYDDAWLQAALQRGKRN